MNSRNQRCTIFFAVLFLSLIFSLNIHKISAEEIGMMYIDAPKSNQIYNNIDVDVAGWALDKSGVRQVEIYLDGTKINDAKYGIYRPDVNAAYPGYPSGDNSGYKYILSKNSISNGYHTIKVRATGINGSSLEKSRQILMKKLPQRLYIDSPAANQTYKSGDIKIAGWALNNSGISKVYVYLDNKLNGEAVYGNSREDVNKVYPGYPSGDYSGYSYNINVDLVSPGSHKIMVKSVGVDGGISESYKYIYISKLPVRMCIDNPKENQTLGGKSFTVGGWALNPSGVKTVKVYIDNNLKGQAVYGNLRTDVNKVYPGYPSENNSGFSYNMDISTLSAGKHILKVEAAGNDGTTYSCIKNISIYKLVPKLYVDVPVNYQVYDNKNITVSGWTLNPEGVNKIEILIDDKLVGQATYGIPRADVNTAFPGYPSGNNPGFLYNIDANSVAPGNHRIKVISYGNDDTTAIVSKYITVKKLPNRSNMENPNMTKYYNDILVSGWALNPSGVSKIDVLLDNKIIGQAAYGSLRTDVDKVYPGYTNGDNCGFNYIITKNIMVDGSHTVGVKIYGNDGTCQVISKNITYDKLDNKMNLESPALNYTSNNQDITVKGYALIPSGTKNIDVFVDNVKKGQASFGLTRSDVGILYPQYSNGSNSGFSYNLDIDSVAPGTHTLNVKVYGIDGTSVSASSSFNVSKPVNRIYMDYPINSGSYYIQDTVVSGWALNASGVKKVNIYLNGNLIGQATTGLSRSDVDKAYPGYKGGTTSGYRYTISKSILNIGTYTIKVEQVGCDGTTISTTKVINIFHAVFSDYSYTLTTAVNKQMALTGGSIPKTDVTGKWLNATADQVKYYLDPNNFMHNETYKYQFLLLNYANTLTADQINSFLDGKGGLEGCGASFVNSAAANNISVAYAVSHSLLETGNGSSQLCKGVLVTTVDGMAVTPKIVYNMFGIAAFDSNPSEAAEYAYKQGWFNKSTAIEAQIQWIAKYYINSTMYKQNTLYKMRWNPVNTGNATHQYATDIGWAYKQAYMIKKIMDLDKNAKLIFDIPQY